MHRKRWREVGQLIGGEPLGRLWSALLVVVALAAGMCFALGMFLPGPVPVSTEPATEAIAAAVHGGEPQALAIRFGYYAQGPGIPDPSPTDAVPVEFTRQGTRCTGRVEGLTGNDPRLLAVDCPDRPLTTDRYRLDGRWMIAGMLVLAAGWGMVRLRHRRRLRSAS